MLDSEDSTGARPKRCRALHVQDGMPAVKQARINVAKNIVRKLGGDEAVKEFETFKLACFNDPDVVALFDSATIRYKVTQSSGIEKLKLARITERRNLWN